MQVNKDIKDDVGGKKKEDTIDNETVASVGV